MERCTFTNTLNVRHSLLSNTPPHTHTHTLNASSPNMCHKVRHGRGGLADTKSTLRGRVQRLTSLSQGQWGEKNGEGKLMREAWAEFCCRGVWGLLVCHVCVFDVGNMWRNPRVDMISHVSLIYVQWIASLEHGHIQRAAPNVLTKWEPTLVCSHSCYITGSGLLGNIVSAAVNPKVQSMLDDQTWTTALSSYKTDLFQQCFPTSLEVKDKYWCLAIRS